MNCTARSPFLELVMILLCFFQTQWNFCAFSNPMEFLCLFQTQWKHTKCKIRKCWYGTDLRLVLVVQQLKRWPINRSLVITDFCPTMTLAIGCSAIKQHFTQCTALFVKGWSTSWWQGLWISVAGILPQMPPPPNCQHQLSPEVTNPANQLKKSPR